MGNNFELMKFQILKYYLFQKQIENFFKNGYNPLYQNKSSQLKIQNFYIINNSIVKRWKIFCQYNIYKYYFDEVKYFDNKFQYVKKLESIYDDLNKINNLEDTNWEIIDLGNFNYNQLKINKNLLDLESFENFLDEEAYKYFKDNIKSQNQLKIKGIITDDKIILFYNELYIIKFLFYDKLDGVNRELIQLTGDFSKFINGIFDIDI